MRVLQVSNLASHHQLPLAREIAKVVGEDNFRFAATAVPDQERLRLGWASEFGDPWIFRAGEVEADRIAFEQWWDEADVVICGERRFTRMGERLAQGKVCFYMSERWWKPPIGKIRLLSPKILKIVREFRAVADHPLFHYLPVGPYAERDIAVLSEMVGRTWRWGYFPDVSDHLHKTINAGPQLKLLWVGRMLGWKRVDTLIRAVSAAINGGADLKLTLIGDGPERASLEKLAGRLLDRDSFVIRDSVSASEIPSIMSENDVYVLPSSAYEGWGAVVNEAMSCGCAVVASKATGAGAAIIKHGINGFLFSPGDSQGLSAQLVSLASDDALRRRLGIEAIRSMSEVWSPSVAASRFLEVAAAVLSKSVMPMYDEGPMSRPR